MDPLRLPDAYPEDSGEKSIDTSEPCRTVEALMPAFVLGALDPDEQDGFLSALQACPQMAGTMQDYTRLVRMLPAAAALPVVRPPDTLAERLAAAVRADAAGAEQHPSAGAIADKPAPRRFLWPSGRATSLPAFAYIAVIALLILLNLYWIFQVTQLRARQSELALRVQRQSDALALLASADVQEIVLPASQEASPARAEVYWNPGWDVAVLYAQDFPRVDADMGFQLWLRKGDVRLSAGVFQVDESGSGTLVFHVPEPLDALDALGITTEPVSGSEGPTGAGVVRFVRQSQ